MKLELTKRAVRDLDTLEHAQPKLFRRAMAKIKLLSDEPKLGKPLIGPLRGKWSLRVGDYRIIYEFDRNTIVVLTINHRREVYK